MTGNWCELPFQMIPGAIRKLFVIKISPPARMIKYNNSNRA